MSLLKPALLGAALILTLTGCAGLSYQQYGSPTQLHTVTPYATRAEVLVNLGEPDAIYKDGARDIFVYKGLTGANYFGLYATIKRDDTIVVIEPDGSIHAEPVVVEVGRGRTFFQAPFFLDATHPIRTTEITDDPSQLRYPGQK